MSLQKAKDFLAHIATDQAASEKARAAHETALMQVASQLGFSFSAADLRQAMDDMGSLDELSASELSSLAGGRIRQRYVDS